VILNVRTETGGYHAIVVDAVKNGQVYIRDPWPAGTGSSYSVPVGALQSVMTGKGVVVQRF
jgi:filamentous hemagglutinin